MSSSLGVADFSLEAGGTSTCYITLDKATWVGLTTGSFLVETPRVKGDAASCFWCPFCLDTLFSPLIILIFCWVDLWQKFKLSHPLQLDPETRHLFEKGMVSGRPQHVGGELLECDHWSLWPWCWHWGGAHRRALIFLPGACLMPHTVWAHFCWNDVWNHGATQILPLKFGHS